jgi:CheY-like chemotaxis protein
MPDAIVVDVDLPDVNGTDILERLKADRVLGRIPVVVATAENDTRVEARCRALGCAAFAVKPCDPQRLIALLVPLPRRTGDGHAVPATERDAGAPRLSAR